MPGLHGDERHRRLHALPGTNQAKALFLNDTYQVADDLTLVRGNHQFGFGGNVQYWKGDYTSTSRANGNWIINGSATGLGLADLLVGRVTSLEHGGPNRVLVNNWYSGRMRRTRGALSSRVTVNCGVRWEPYFGQNVENNAISIFEMENFQQGIKSKVFLNAPAGLHLSGRRGIPAGTDRAEQAVVEPLAARAAWRGTSTGTAAWPCGRRTRWATTSWPASTTTSTPAPRRSATARLITDPPGLHGRSRIAPSAAIPTRS